MWQKLLAWAKDSETILLARFQMLAGILLTVIATFDPSVLAPLIGDKWFGPFLFAWGVIAEAARRYRAEDLK